VSVLHQHSGGGIYQKEQRRWLTRDAAAEEQARSRLRQLGFRKGFEFDRADLELPPDQLPKVVRALTQEGWRVEVEGDIYRTPGALSMAVSSGVDWFELEGGAEFGATKVGLPRLLRAIKQDTRAATRLAWNHSRVVMGTKCSPAWATRTMTGCGSTAHRLACSMLARFGAGGLR
jgi:hypothetical protein